MFMPAFLRSLCRDERGSILVQATIILVVIMGMIGLALDGGRYFMVNNDLQDLADAAALAGAAKLNGITGAKQNAETAARSMGDACAGSDCNGVRWYDVSAAKILSGTNGVQFYKTLADLDANNPAPDDKSANYIKVTTGSWQVAPTFLVAIGAISNSTRATAVAESRTAMCVPASMMLCNPNEPQTGSTGDTSNFNPTRGTMFVFSTQGNTGGFSPGVFNLLQDENNCNSDPCVKKLLSLQNADLCTTGGTSPAQGQKTNATIDGINVRFDQPPNGNTNGMDLAPAPIPIDGWSTTKQGNNCSVNDVRPTSFNPDTYANCNSSGSCPLPRDNPLNAVNPTANGGTWTGGGPNAVDLQTYWNNHHGTTTLPSGVSTRLDVYQCELGVGNFAGVAGCPPSSWLTDPPPTSGREAHAPQCSSTVSSEFNYTRRIIPVAIVDCLYWGVQGNSVNDIRTNSYADFFITEPTPCPSCSGGGRIYTEFVKIHQIDQSDSGLHSVIRLVR
jgi:Flp pilus assembly protein TadG